MSSVKVFKHPTGKEFYVCGVVDKVHPRMSHYYDVIIDTFTTVSGYVFEHLLDDDQREKGAWMLYDYEEKTDERERELAAGNIGEKVCPLQKDDENKFGWQAYLAKHYPASSSSSSSSSSASSSSSSSK